MTKTKLHETVLTICETHGATAELTAALSELTKPKVGGSASVEDYTAYDGEVVTHVLCTYHKQWEPVANDDGDELFKTSDKTKNGYERSCIEGEKQWKEQAKVFNTSKTAIVTDVMDEVITGPEGKAAIAELQAARDNRLAREDGLGSTDKPEV